MSNIIKILFWLYKGRSNEQGLTPLMLRLTYNKKRIQASTGFYMDASKWDAKKSKVKGGSEEAKLVNDYIRNTHNRLLEIFQEQSKKGEVLLEAVYDKFMGKDIETMTLMQLVTLHNGFIKERVGIDYSPATFIKYDVTRKKLLSFLAHLGKKDVRLVDLNRKFIADFDYYMKSVDGNSHNTTTKYCKNLKTILNLALLNGWLDKNPFLQFKTVYKLNQKVYLSQDELTSIQNKQFKTDRLTKVRDMFLFQCYTGLAFVDMLNLKCADITTGIDGNKWIIKNRQKTEIRSAIPLLTPAIQVIEKYKPNYANTPLDPLLPMFSNQKYNAYLQEIADVSGINKNLTSHVGRRTFATTVALSNGVSIETISKILGHSTTKITHQYAVVTDLKVSQEMEKLKGTMKEKGAG